MMANFEFTTETASLMGAVIFFAGVVIGAVFGRIPMRYFRFFRSFSRALTFPLRRLGLLGRTSRRIRGVRNAAVSSSAAFSLFERKTEIEQAIFLMRHDLYRPGKEIDLDEAKIKELEDKAEEFERSYLVRSRGLLFNRISVPAAYTPRWFDAGLNTEVVNEFRDAADAYFNGQVDISFNSNALYEEVDGAHTIYMFGKTDLPAYNLINEARKTVNENAFKLIMSFLILIIGSFSVVLFKTEASYLSAGILVAAGGLMAFVEFAYKNMQEHSIRSLGKFMNLYVGYIGDHFRDVTGKAQSVPVGNEKDPKVLAETARSWNKIMVWMAFRSFFIETFLRNELYQIHRNSDYYRLFSDALILVVPALIAVGHYIGVYDLRVYTDAAGLAVAAASVFLILLYVFLIRIQVITSELELQDWRGFDKLRLGQKMDDVVGKYAEEIGYWKQRLER